MTAILWALVGGAVIGLLVKVVAPGDGSRVALWLTVTCGVGGALLGSWLYGVIFTPKPGGFGLWRLVAQVLLAGCLTTLATTVALRRH